MKRVCTSRSAGFIPRFIPLESTSPNGTSPGGPEFGSPPAYAASSSDMTPSILSRVTCLAADDSSNMLRCRLCVPRRFALVASTSRAVMRGVLSLSSSPTPSAARSPSTGDAVLPKRAPRRSSPSCESSPFSVDDDGVRSGHDAVRTSRGVGVSPLSTVRSANFGFFAPLTLGSFSSDSAWAWRLRSRARARARTPRAPPPSQPPTPSARTAREAPGTTDRRGNKSPPAPASRQRTARFPRQPPRSPRRPRSRSSTAPYQPRGYTDRVRDSLEQQRSVPA